MMNRLKTYGWVSLFVFLVVSCGKNPKAKIEGTFSGVSEDTVVLEMISARERIVIDTVLTDRKGFYKFKVDIPEKAPMFFNLICDGSTIPLIVAPGEKLTINSLCDLGRNYTVEGSESSRLLREFNTFYNQSVSTLDSLSQLFTNIPSDKEHEANKKEILDKYLKEYYRIKREHIKFILSNASSMAAIYALYQRLPNDTWLYNETSDLIYYQTVADSLSTHYPTSSRVKALQNEIDQRKKTIDLIQQISTIEESDSLSFPEIELQDVNGKNRKLTDYQGKTILLDFWSLKDTHSSVNNAEMKELHKLYADKDLVIFQVSLGDEKADWIATVRGQKLPWICVYDSKGASGIAAMSYNIQSVPANVLIDSEGKIVGRNIFGEELKDKIAELIR